VKQPENKVPEYVSKADNVLEAKPIKDYVAAAEKLHNDGEDLFTLDNYKENVKKMLLSQK
jgi:hypothetical protein